MIKSRRKRKKVAMTKDRVGTVRFCSISQVFFELFGHYPSKKHKFKSTQLIIMNEITN